MNKIEFKEKIYCSIDDYYFEAKGGRYNGAVAKDRKKLREYIEVNDYFDHVLYYPDELNANEDGMDYILEEDLNDISNNIKEFLAVFDFDCREKIQYYMNMSLLSEHDKSLLLEYIDSQNVTDSVKASFIEILSQISSISYLDSDEIIEILQKCKIKAARKEIVNFLNTYKHTHVTSYGFIDIKPNKEIPIRVEHTAYSYRTYAEIAECIFNKKNATDNKMIEKALLSSADAERWLFLSCFYCCGWRSADVCNAWVYPQLDKNNIFEIDVNNLYYDILNDNIPDEKYIKICDYVIKSIELSGKMPSKTLSGELDLAILPNMRAHYGKLTLICVYHNHINSNEGFMKESRISQYRNWYENKAFFGNKIYEIIGNKNIRTKRLNRSYLQCVEREARENGNSPLQAQMIAALARNHKNICTTSIYLRDANLTGEDAGTILYMMAERGIQSMYMYTMIQAAYPDAFSRLSFEDQTDILKLIPLEAFEIETMANSLNAAEDISSYFEIGKVRETHAILKAMYEISATGGISKDDGVGCIRTALGYGCPYPPRGCLSSACKFCVLTSAGVDTLIQVVRDYIYKYETTHNPKYRDVLDQKIIPTFREVLEKLYSDMSSEDVVLLKRYIKENL